MVLLVPRDEYVRNDQVQICNGEGNDHAGAPNLQEIQEGDSVSLLLSQTYCNDVGRSADKGGVAAHATSIC